MGFVERVLTEEPASLEQIRSSLKVHYELYVRKFDLEEAMDDLLEMKKAEKFLELYKII